MHSFFPSTLLSTWVLSYACFLRISSEISIVSGLESKQEMCESPSKSIPNPNKTQLPTKERKKKKTRKRRRFVLTSIGSKSKTKTKNRKRKKLNTKNAIVREMTDKERLQQMLHSCEQAFAYTNDNMHLIQDSMDSVCILSLYISLIIRYYLHRLMLSMMS